MSDILDLDALIPQGAQVIFGGKKYMAHPPSAEVVFRLTKLGADQYRLGLKMQAGGDKDTESLLQALEENRDLQKEMIKKSIPKLDVSPLTAGQTSGLVQWLLRLGVPQGAQEDVEQAKKNRKRSKAG